MTCPNCGYCPHCGRGANNLWPKPPFIPWNQPWYINTAPTWTVTTATNTDNWQAEVDKMLKIIAQKPLRGDEFGSGEGPKTN